VEQLSTDVYVWYEGSSNHKNAILKDYIFLEFFI